MFAKFLKAVRGEEEDPDTVETIACRVEDMKDGEMRQIELGEGKALLVKDEGQFYAVGHKCTHYGAPLHKGAYCNGRVRCPWHGACFNVKTGDIEDFPGLDSIPKYKVKIDKGDVKVSGTKSQIENFRHVRTSCSRDAADNRTFVVIGAGGAGASCVETLRQEGFTGRVVMVSKESHLPYDRPKLSKMLDAKAESLEMRKTDFYHDMQIERLTAEVTGLDVSGKMLKFADGQTLQYDKVVFATGGSPRALGIPGESLDNVYMLRSVEDGNRISASCEDKNVVVIGSSFIGLEVAAYMLDKGKAASVKIVGRSDVPLKHVLGEKVGLVVKKLLENKGAKFVFKNPPVEFLGEDNKLSGVKLTDGTVLDAHLCVIGAGVSANINYIKESGVNLSNDGFVLVNKNMLTSKPDVYAAGDITKFPLFLIDDEIANIQHWQMAIMQGRIAGLNMTSRATEIHSVPFFWTMILGKGIRYAGYGNGHDDVVVQGSLEDHKFIAYYIKGDKVIAVATMGSDPVAAQAAEMFYNKKSFTKADILNDDASPPAWTANLSQATKL